MVGVRLADGLGVEVGLDLAGGGVARADVAAEAAETLHGAAHGGIVEAEGDGEQRRGGKA